MHDERREPPIGPEGRVAFTPPARWKKVPPRVEGIEVWAPTQDDVPTDLDVGGGPEPSGRPRVGGLGVERREVVCGGCGATIAVAEGPVSTRCPLCAASRVVLRDRHRSSAPRPEEILPFVVTAGEARDRVRAWLGRGWFRPWDLVVLAHTEAFTGLYVPFWLGEATVDAEWRAQVGHDRIERSRELGAVGRAVVDWRWETGRVRAPGAVRVPATTRLAERAIAEAQVDTTLRDLVPYEPTAVAGVHVLAPDRGLPEALDLGRQRFAALARDACRASVGSPRVRTLSVTHDLRQESWRPALLPLWVSSYRYGDRTFVVLVDGATGRVVGQKPVVWRRVGFAIAMLTAPGILLTTVGLPLLFVAVGVVVLPMGLALLVLGGLASAWLWWSAAASEEP